MRILFIIPLALMALILSLRWDIVTNNLSGKGLMCDPVDYPRGDYKYITHQKEKLVAIYFVSPNEFITKFIRLGMDPKIQQNGVFNYRRFENEISLSVLWEKGFINIKSGIWTQIRSFGSKSYQCSKFMTHRKLDQEMQKQLAKH